MQRKIKNLFTVLFLASALAGHSQIISKFTWNSSPLTKAAIGPNGTSISASAHMDTVASPVNYAINPSLPKKDIDLVVPGSPYFDVSGIDIDLYARREETEASFFKRGSVFDFGFVNGQLYVNFKTNKGISPGTVAVNSGNIAIIPEDHAFHHYRFKYDNNTGVANVYVDNIVVYTYTGTPGYTLNWTGAGDVVIGSKMDATGRNIAVLGDLTVQIPSTTSATLPVSLLSFEASAKDNAAILTWTTTRELNVQEFIVESSPAGTQFNAVTSVKAAGSYDLVHRYLATDNSLHSTVVYYRLKMVDIDGKASYSEVKKLSFSGSSSITCYPNPAKDYVRVSMINATAGDFKYVVMAMNGSIVKAAAVHLETGVQEIRIDLSSNMPSSALLIQVVNVQQNKVESFKIIKG